MAIMSVNPATGEALQVFEPLHSDEISDRIDQAQQAWHQYRHQSLKQRAAWLLQAAHQLIDRADQWAEIMTLEMGKPIQAAIAEVQKCAWVCRYYAEHAATQLSPQTIETDAVDSYVMYQPLGIVLAVMPWNFPFWQVFRCAAPALMAGNVVLLKHASNVPQCALAIESIFKDAGFPAGVFQSLLITAPQVKDLLTDDRIQAVSLTGSEAAGASVAALAGEQIKKSVLELGGSDPFIVLESADLAAAVQAGATSRLINNGQSCIAAKRFILAESIADAFEQQLTEKFTHLTIGDPFHEETDLGPLATTAILHRLQAQVQSCVDRGARLVMGGQPLHLSGYYYPPTILADLPPGTPADTEEFFGPVALLFRVPDLDAAIALANRTPYGLGASAWTQDSQEIHRLVRDLQAGAVFINGLVKSDPRLPFGGIKKSGYGRELGAEGIREFVNIKTIWIDKDPSG